MLSSTPFSTKDSSRKDYYTTKHESAEDEISRELEFAWGVVVHKTSKYRRYDYACTRGRSVVAFAELKDRSKNSNKYPTFMIGIEKWVFLCSLSEQSGIPAFLVVRFLDGIFYAHASRGDYLVQFDPNWNSYRGDDRDIEPSIHVPMSLFKPLWGSE